jgi:hypothetical protein
MFSSALNARWILSSETMDQDHVPAISERIETNHTVEL